MRERFMNVAMGMRLAAVNEVTALPKSAATFKLPAEVRAEGVMEPTTRL